MLKKFALKNYKNFRDEIKIDFENVAGYQFSTDCIADGVIAKMLIYGRNATGKTNLGRAIMDIGPTMFSGSGLTENGVFLNADSQEDAAKFSYTFCFNDDEMIYQYTRFSDIELRDEELIVNGVLIFRCDFLNNEYHFENLKDVDADTAKFERYLQALDNSGEMADNNEPKLPFLRWLISNVALKNDSILIRLANYVRRMVMINVGNGAPYRVRSMYRTFYESLENPERLKDLEDFLNAMGIECELVLRKLPDGESQLYFKHEKLVPFYENASSGTLALVDLYRRVIPKVWDASLIYLDEFDAFYHYEMAECVIKFFKKKYPRCQMIMTSHNTNLMTNRLMRPDCMFILSRGGTLTALCNATTRELREGHNLEKMYISGEFEKYE
ncbi:MAG: ATP-binding protein [Roseburia sp.]|nr:ATP-binding protein [Roseburia sp.]